MMAQGSISEKRPGLFRKDSQYAIGQLSSIIKDNDYKDLGNHATEAMGEIGLFSLAQVCIRSFLFPVSLLPLFLNLCFDF